MSEAPEGPPVDDVHCGAMAIGSREADEEAAVLEEVWYVDWGGQCGVGWAVGVGVGDPRPDLVAWSSVLDPGADRPPSLEVDPGSCGLDGDDRGGVKRDVVAVPVAELRITVRVEFDGDGVEVAAGVGSGVGLEAEIAVGGPQEGGGRGEYERDSVTVRRGWEDPEPELREEGIRGGTRLGEEESDWAVEESTTCADSVGGVGSQGDGGLAPDHRRSADQLELGQPRRAAEGDVAGVPGASVERRREEEEEEEDASGGCGVGRRHCDGEVEDGNGRGRTSQCLRCDL